MPSNIILIFLLALMYGNIANAGGAVVKYKLALDEKRDGLVVEVQFKGKVSGKTDLYIPILSNFAIAEAVVRSNSGTTILKEHKNDVMKCMHNYPHSCTVISIEHPPGADISISYYIKNAVGALISPDEIFFDGGMILIFPALGKPHVIFDWSELNMKTAKIMSSSSIQDMSTHSSMNKNSLFSHWYIFTNLEIHSSVMEGAPNLLVTTVGFPEGSKADLKTFALTHTHLTDISNKIIGANHSFISDILGNLSIIRKKSILLLNVKADNSIHEPWIGFHTTDMQAVLVREDAEHSNIAHTISHEYMHELFSHHGSVSVNFGPAVTVTKFLWFDEGFADYYADLLNYRNGIISKQEYANILNDALKDYYKRYHPIHNMMGNTCQRKTMFVQSLLQSDNFFAINYISGRLIALDLDNIIQSRSNGNWRLEDLLHNVIESSCTQLPCYIEKKQFLIALGKLVNSTAKNLLDGYIDKHIVNFVPISLPSAIVEPNMMLSHKEIRNMYNYGFNIDKAFCTGIIDGVEENNNAYAAGLRNNTALSFIGSTFEPNALKNGEIEMVIEIEVKNPGSNSTVIQYHPIGTVAIPYYALH